jgi:predicted transcriptional regulator
MFGLSLDDSPDRPVSTPAARRAQAIHWNWTTEATNAEIADALGVRPETVSRYLNDGPTDAVREQMEGVEAEVRMVAVAELRDQLQAAGDRARSAEKPVKVWTDANGNLTVRDERNPETGEVLDKYAVPSGMELGANEEARYYARDEVRQILDQLVALTGAGEPDEVAVEHSGGVNVTVENTVVETDAYEE